MRRLLVLILLCSSVVFAQRHRSVISGSAPQILRPISDVSTTGWTSTEANIWSAVAQPSDSKFITSVVLGTADATVDLASGTDPGVDTGHKIHIRIITLGDDFSLTLVDATNGDIATVTLGQLAVGNNTIDIAEANVADISDYTTLTMRLISNAITTGTVVDEVYLETP